MKAPIKILLLEDAPFDVDLVERELRRGKIAYEKLVVDNQTDYETALQEFVPDIILSDHSLPNFDSIKALKILNDSNSEIPFILITATVSEEFAVEVMKMGAFDYLLKDRLQRLPVSVTNALEKHREREEKKNFYEQVIKNESQMRHTLDSMIGGAQVHGFDWRYLYVNDTLVSYSTYGRKELIGYTIMEKYPGIEQTDLFKAMERCMYNREPIKLETEFVFPDGTKGDFELSIQPIPEGIFILSMDRSEQRKAEEKLLKVNHLYAFISQLNQNIVRIKEEEALFKNSCRIAVEFGKFKMAWIGLYEESGKKINLVEECGMPASEIHHLKDRWCTVDGPQDHVLREGKHYISNDIQNEPDMLFWKPLAVAYDINSCIVLPIMKAGEIFGTFNLYSQKLNFSDIEEITLLEELAEDISFALDQFEKEKLLKETRATIRDNERRFRALIEKSPDMETLSTADGKLIYGSPSITKVLGYTLEEFVDLEVIEFIHPEDIPHYIEKRKKIVSKPGKSFHFEMRCRHKNKTWIWCEGTVTNMMEEPSVSAFVSNFRDVSDKKTAEQLREFSQNNLHALINNTKDLMWSVDTNFKLITSNEPFDAMVKVMVGLDILKNTNVLQYITTNEQMNRYKKLYQRAFKGESFSITEHTFTPIEYWSEISFYPIRKGNHIIGTACHARNISELKTAEQLVQKSETFSRNIFNSLTAHIAVVDHTGKILAVNESWTRFGIENGESRLQRAGINSNYFDVCTNSSALGDTMAAEVLKGMQEVMDKTRTTFYLEYPCDFEDTKRWFSLLTVPFDGEEELLVVAHHDISKRKLAEDKLIANNKELVKTNFELDRFVYSVSHDLRSPLTSMLGLLTFIEEESQEEETLEHSKMIRTSINRLDDYIKNILSYSRNKRVELHAEEIPLEEIAHEIVDSLSNIKGAESIVFGIDIKESYPFYSDRQGVTTILENLISNAIKFQKKDTPDRYIKISGKSEKKTLKLIVTDNGIGISAEHHHSLFDMFFRLSGKIPGSGIGLYIVREIVEKLYGNITVESEEGKGTSFSIQLKNLKP